MSSQGRLLHAAAVVDANYGWFVCNILFLDIVLGNTNSVVLKQI